MATISYQQDADGCKFIPATQRPDGTWRKPRRVKEGYVPQDEVPLYESRGKQFKARQSTGLPVGLTPEIVAEAQKKKNPGNAAQNIPGMLVNVDKNKKKKKKKSGVDDATEKLAKVEITEPKFTEAPSKLSKVAPPPLITAPSQSDPVKRLKNLRKKLRDIETLEEKIKSGVLANPDKDQKEKMSKKTEVIKEIDSLEKEIGV